MSNPLIDVLGRTEDKLKRQEALRDATIAEMEILGETARNMNRLERQNKAIRDTKADLTKIRKAVSAADK